MTVKTWHDRAHDREHRRIAKERALVLLWCLAQLGFLAICLSPFFYLLLSQ